MSKYTTEIRFICESLSGLSESEGADKVDDIIESARTKIFDFDYDIFDTDYKPVLESKILSHFYTREIGLETYGLFHLKLQTKMREIMPYYNQLYESELIQINPMTDVSYSRSGSESNSLSESTFSSLSTSESNLSSEIHSNSMWNMFQDTPQNGLNGVESMEYLTNATLDKGHETNSASDLTAIASAGRGSADRKDLKSYLEKFEGYRSNNPSKLLQEYRKTFLNIDLMVIGELEELFMQLW